MSQITSSHTTQLIILPDCAQFYIKPRMGALYSVAKATKLKAMLESSIQRRFPRGLKVHVHSVDRFGCLAQLTRVLKNADLAITRAKVGCPYPPLMG